MKTPKIIYSDKILNRLSLFMKIGGITIWPFIILREIYDASSPLRRKAARIINHESIHIKQQEELLVLPFYIFYILEWLLKLPFYGKQAYYNISFEREAYENDDNLSYLKTRKRYNWLKKIF
jgi:hypothetical protein